ncbi:MAG: response regulator [Elusimicrobia bacterium]|nr:response regulator [Elusimicrobiota bacterium]
MRLAMATDHRSSHPGAILIVESEPLILQVCQRVFHREGYVFDVAQSITEAEGFLARARDYDLLIIDLRFNDGNGLDFAQVFRRHHPQACVLVMTGLSTMESQTRALELRLEDYIAKPFDIGQIRLSVKNIFLRKANRDRMPDRSIIWLAAGTEESVGLGLKALELAGFRCEIIDRVALARSRIEAGEIPQVVIADAGLSEADVLDFCGQVKRSSRARELPIVLLALNPEFMLAQARRVGVSLILEKPQKPYDLVHQIEDILR